MVMLFGMETFALVACKNHPEYDTYIEGTDYESNDVYLSQNKNEETQLDNTKECSPIETTIYVDIGGAVMHPGVYELPKDARLFEAVKAAGGLLENASLDALNQAEVLSDGQKIYVMTKSEWEEQKLQFITESNIENDGKVNINIADTSELCTLPGIGQTRAEAIISYREKNGKFSSVEEIQNVSGIKNGTYDKICDLIKVE